MGVNMEEPRDSLTSTLARGVAAGLAGTSWMTAAQEISGSGGENGDGPPSWDEAPAPAQVARKALRAVGVDPPRKWIPFLTHAMHWATGTGWGIVYTLARGRRTSGTIGEGLAFGAAVWVASYAELVPLGIYEPPWAYDVKQLAQDLGYHLAYGVGVVSAADALR
jgi:hypothetical protein